MLEYLNFFYRHIELSIALIVILLLILWEEFGSRRYTKAGIVPQTLITLMNHEGGIVLDIRTQEMFNRGHIVHSLNIPAQALMSNLKKLIKYKNSPIIIVDDNNQAASALKQLKQNGFQKLYKLSGGLAAWKQAGLPLTESKNKGKAHA